MLFLLLSAVGWVNIGFGQVGCDISSTISDAVVKYQDWDWEDRSCKMWRANIGDNSLENMGTPFFNSTGSLGQLALNGDYKKTLGWVLIRRDFGLAASQSVPFFILYNKNTGILRVFYYLSYKVVFEGSSITVSLCNAENINAHRNPAVVSFNNKITYPTDVYQQTKITDANMVYVTPFPGTSAWGMAEFYLTFDPNIKDPNLAQNYLGTRLQINITNIKSSDVQAKITGTSKTVPLPESYSFNTSNIVPKKDSKGQDIKDFIATGSKFIDKSNKWNKDSVLKDYVKHAIKYDTSKTSLVSWVGKQLLANKSNVKEMLSTVKDILNVAGPVFSFAGTIAGYLFPNDNSSVNTGPTNVVVMPTSTTYNLNLDGTIVSSSLIKKIEFSVPSSVLNQDVISAGNISYYDCPLGLLNVNNVQEVEKINYTQLLKHKEYNTYYTYRTSYSYVDSMFNINLSRFKLRNPLSISVNSNSDMEIVDVKASLISSFTNTIDLNYDRYSYGVNGPIYTQSRNMGLLKKISYLNYEKYISNYKEYYVQDGSTNISKQQEKILNVDSEIKKGNYNLLSYDAKNNQIEIQSPYLDLGCINNYIFDGFPQNSNIRVRIKAILKKKGTSYESVPYVVIQDYFINETTVNQTAFTSNYTGLTPLIVDFTETNKVYDKNTTIKAIDEINLGGGASGQKVSISPNISVDLTSEMLINLLPGMEIPSGSNFSANISNRGYQINCTNVTPQYLVYNCGYNANASRKSDIDELSQTIGNNIAPNPFQDNFKIDLSKYENNIKNVIIFDQMGREVKSFFVSETENELFVDLINSQTGLYLVKIQTSIGSETIKIIKQ